jgi:uncharacterized PurR-regulated membrane protein YhhQ (DUF165 family)
MSSLNVTPKRAYCCLTYIIAIYTFFFILPSILLRKMVDIPVLGTIPVSILFTGTYFMLLDVVTEVYGYYEARRVLLAGLFAYSLFVLTMSLINHIPSPHSYNVAWSSVQDPDAYIYLFNNLYLVWIAVVFCALIANTLNMIVLSKWKILVKGRYFWIRSISTSLVAAVIFSSISNLFAFGFFLHKAQLGYFFELIFISVSAKLLTLLVLAYPSTLLTHFLKRKEGIDVYDYGISYNPFRSSHGETK